MSETANEQVTVLKQQLAQWRHLGQAADAVLAQAKEIADHWHVVPSDAIRDLRTARTETERT